jgi:hypothetical protein
MTAEFMGQKPISPCDGFNAFGKPVSFERRLIADKHLVAMGITDTNIRFATIQAMANAIERDNPYQAMSEGMRAVDLTGVYRLLAVLCTA